MKTSSTNQTLPMSNQNTFLVSALLLICALQHSCIAESYNCKPNGQNINCTCQFVADFNGTTIDCTGRNLTSFPVNFETVDTDKEPIVSLDLTNNTIQEITEYSLTNYPSLAHLVMHKCGVNTIASDAFSSSALKLDKLILSDNPEIRKMPTFDVPLKELDMTNCGLNYSELDLSGKLPFSLFSLILDNNGLYQWPTNFPSKIGVLSLRNNQLTTIASLSSDLERLAELYLDHNQISKLDEKVPSLPSTLQNLSMDYNPLYGVDNDYFHNLNYIQEMSLSHAYLSSISEIAFEGMSPQYSGHAITLRFQYNSQLTKVYRETFDPFLHSVNKYDLLEIKLEGAALNCECEMIWIPELFESIANHEEYSPQTVSITGTCFTPQRLSGKSLSELKTSDIQCPVPTASPNSDGSSSSGKTVAVVLGIILSLVFVTSLGYFLYNRYFRNTYLSL